MIGFTLPGFPLLGFTLLLVGLLGFALLVVGLWPPRRDVAADFADEVEVEVDLGELDAPPPATPAARPAAPAARPPTVIVRTLPSHSGPRNFVTRRDS